MGSGFSKMKKQAKLLQEQMEKEKERLKSLEVQGSAGNGLVSLVMTGEKRIKSLTINPECVDPEDLEGLQDLIIAAQEDALIKVEEQENSDATGGFPFGF